MHIIRHSVRCVSGASTCCGAHVAIPIGRCLVGFLSRVGVWRGARSRRACARAMGARLEHIRAPSQDRCTRVRSRCVLGMAPCVLPARADCGCLCIAPFRQFGMKSGARPFSAPSLSRWGREDRGKAKSSKLKLGCRSLACARFVVRLFGKILALVDAVFRLDDVLLFGGWRVLLSRLLRAVFVRLRLRRLVLHASCSSHDAGGTALHRE